MHSGGNLYGTMCILITNELWYVFNCWNAVTTDLQPNMMYMVFIIKICRQIFKMFRNRFSQELYSSTSNERLIQGPRGPSKYQKYTSCQDVLPLAVELKLWSGRCYYYFIFCFQSNILKNIFVTGYIETLSCSGEIRFVWNKNKQITKTCVINFLLWLSLMVVMCYLKRTSTLGEF